jgi:hypothetical protein
MRLSHVLAAAVLAGVAGCGSTEPLPTGPYQPFTSDPSQPFSMIVVNIDGPPVDVYVDGAKAAHAVCAPGGVEVPPTVVSSAPFPWYVEVRRSDGSLLGSFDASDSIGPLTIVVRTDSATVIPRGQNIGPAPGATCAP